jgi:hypothetical protein
LRLPAEKLGSGLLGTLAVPGSHVAAGSRPSHHNFFEAAETLLVEALVRAEQDGHLCRDVVVRGVEISLELTGLVRVLAEGLLELGVDLLVVLEQAVKRGLLVVDAAPRDHLVGEVTDGSLKVRLERRRQVGVGGRRLMLAHRHNLQHTS